jgi:hypothetical protein
MNSFLSAYLNASQHGATSDAVVCIGTPPARAFSLAQA